LTAYLVESLCILQNLCLLLYDILTAGLQFIYCILDRKLLGDHWCRLRSVFETSLTSRFVLIMLTGVCMPRQISPLWTLWSHKTMLISCWSHNYCSLIYI